MPKPISRTTGSPSNSSARSRTRLPSMSRPHVGHSRSRDSCWPVVTRAAARLEAADAALVVRTGLGVGGGAAGEARLHAAGAPARRRRRRSAAASSAAVGSASASAAVEPVPRGGGRRLVGRRRVVGSGGRGVQGLLRHNDRILRRAASTRPRARRSASRATSRPMGRHAVAAGDGALEHMHGVRGLADEEVVDQRAVPQHRLGPHSPAGDGRRSSSVTGGQQPLDGPGERGPGQRAVHLARPVTPVAAGDLPGARPAQRGQQFGGGGPGARCIPRGPGRGTAFGPTWTEPVEPRVRWTPRKGNAGSGTG